VPQHPPRQEREREREGEKETAPLSVAAIARRASTAFCPAFMIRAPNKPSRGPALRGWDSPRPLESPLTCRGDMRTTPPWFRDPQRRSASGMSVAGSVTTPRQGGKILAPRLRRTTRRHPADSANLETNRPGNLQPPAVSSPSLPSFARPLATFGRFFRVDVRLRRSPRDRRVIRHYFGDKVALMSTLSRRLR